MTQRRTPWLMAILGLLVFVIAACTPSTPTTGKLTVTITGLPSGTNADVTVKKPDNSTLGTATATKTFPDLAPGPYTVTANPVAAGSNTYAPTVTGSPAAVTAGTEKTVTVAYALVPPTKGSINVTLSGLPSGAAAPTITASKSGSASQTRTGAGLIAGLDPGTWSVSGANVDHTDGFRYGANAVNANVTAGGTVDAALAYSKRTAKLTVTITGLAAGTNANVTVTKPGGATQTLTATTTLTLLDPGSYSVSGAAVTGYGTPTVTGSPVTLAPGDDKSVTVTYTPTGTSGNLVVNLTGMGTGTFSGKVRVKKGTDAEVIQNVPSNGGAVTFAALPFGSYSITANVIKDGTYVDTFFFTPSAATFNHAAAGNSTSVAMTQRGGSGRVFLAGNGAFNDEPTATTQSNAIYSITDANLGLGSPVLDTVLAPSSTLGAFRVTFDKSGNMYIIYQNLLATGLGNARIVRVTEANLRANKLAETDAGNVKITGFTGPGPAFFSEPADIAFDAQDNMWLVNDKGGNITCYSAASMKAAEASGSLSTYNQKLVDAAAAAGVFRNPHSVAFDRDDHLWFTSDKTSSDAPPTGDLAFKSRLARVNKSVLNCTGTNVDTAVTPDIILDISNSNPANPGGVIVKPIVLVLAPDGKSFWIADYGGDDRGDKDPENILQIPLTGTNITTNTGADPAGGKEALFGFRLYTADFINFNSNPSYAPQSQIQQPFGLAFDKNGDIWVATNNNISRLNPAPTPEITDFKGKLWQIKIPTTSDAGCMSFAGGFAVSTRASGKAPCDENLANYVPNPIQKVISAPVTGVGFVGISFNIAPANAPMYVRPTP